MHKDLKFDEEVIRLTYPTETVIKSYPKIFLSTFVQIKKHLKDPVQAFCPQPCLGRTKLRERYFEA